MYLKKEQTQKANKGLTM